MKARIPKNMGGAQNANQLVRQAENAGPDYRASG